MNLETFWDQFTYKNMKNYVSYPNADVKNADLLWLIWAKNTKIIFFQWKLNNI